MIKLDIASSPPTASITTNPDTAARIIATMLHSDRTIPEIADEFRLSFAQMMALLETPFAEAEIEAIGKLSALRDKLRAPIRRENALHRLAHITAYSLDELEARRAATTLIKAQPRAPPAAPAAAPADASPAPTPQPSAQALTPPATPALAGIPAPGANPARTQDLKSQVSKLKSGDQPPPPERSSPPTLSPPPPNTIARASVTTHRAAK